MAANYAERQIAAARVEQINRVNSRTVFEDMAEMRLQLDRLQLLLQAERGERAAQDEEIAQLRSTVALYEKAAHAKGLHLGERAVCTQSEAARILGVKPYQISRWLKSGDLTGVAVPGKRALMLYKDSLRIPPSKGRGRPRK